MKNIFNILFISIVAIYFASCNEKDDSDKEWLQKNMAFYEKIQADPEWSELDLIEGAPRGIYYKKLENEGTGVGTEYPIETATVKVLYEGWLYDGTVFDSGTSKREFINVSELNPKTGKEGVIYILWKGDKYELYRWLPGAQKYEEDNYSIPTFKVNELVTGFSVAVQSMVVGDKWEICIPYYLGYGNTTYRGIPAYSTLNFRIQLLEVIQKSE